MTEACTRKRAPAPGWLPALLNLDGNRITGISETGQVTYASLENRHVCPPSPERDNSRHPDPNVTHPGMSDAAASADTPFATLGLDERILSALDTMGFVEPTPIQLEAIPALLEGHDVVGGARTGSGKTAAFGLPVLENVKEGDNTVRAIVLCPTRELALQVTDAMRAMAKKLPVRLLCVYGGAPFPPQLQALKKGVPVVVGTPGRVLDHVRRGSLDLSGVRMFVLDEADEMLRMGFLEDVEEILQQTSDDRQVALFSATMPDPIRRIAAKYLHNPVNVHVESEGLTTTHITQQVLYVPQRSKIDALVRLLDATDHDAMLVFARTRRGCAEAADALAVRGVAVDAIHGDLAQAARERVLTKLRAQRIDVVIATDVAARGIDVDHITHVVNLDLPDDPEVYVHRIGRTGRAGREGTAISLVTPRERPRIRRFQKALDAPIEEVQVPSDAEIETARREKLFARLYQQVNEGPKERTVDLVEMLDENIDLMSILCASLELLAADEGIDLETVPDEAPPAWTQKATRTRKERESSAGIEDGVELMVTVGRHKGLRPGDLVGALINEKGVPGGAIGKVTVLPRRSFIMLERSEAERLAGQNFFLRGHAADLWWANPDDAPQDKPQKIRVKKAGTNKPRPSHARHDDDDGGGRPPRPAPKGGAARKKRHEKPTGEKQRWRKGDGKKGKAAGKPPPRSPANKPDGAAPGAKKTSGPKKKPRPAAAKKPGTKKSRFGHKPKTG